MAITIDGKEYDEATLDNNVKNSINQVQNSNQTIARLQAEILNQQILAQHHSKYIKDNLPVDEEGTTESITTNSAADAVAAAEAEIK
jgi:copper oxidase (laccase) domain-containing protein